ncbi:MAG: ABC transporter substrate-binding protein [Armatimonadota bacterium]|nr:ABC transporter substrate-binding protein [Armatimonadota bacterium]MDR7450704.1 ABC transporter substrate-binding protein [Armatimonadota bacterium]MDR7466060.1 ABC transporter substrate-binding protein [Armatimonadota bacterium]MDR7493903.1 ABC transporter substrate-binding protein [Armatimonadota bacterium]MDR7504008.1 ABC transporter substrate-binding protein [Armatimonadota bacterium]
MTRGWWRIATVTVGLALIFGAAASGQAPDRRVRELVLLTRPQAVDPREFETARFLAPEFEKLGLKVSVRVMPWEQMADLVWYSRDKWDMTMWQMVGRPERSDPDEFAMNLFHSSTAEKGYNFVGYRNRTYDSIAEAQRIKTDLKTRQQLIREAQKIIARDVPYIFLVFPESTYVYNNTVWDPKTIVDQKGIGIKNFWTFIQARPLGGQQDMILNYPDPLQAINPLFISGAADSWVTELIWDRLFRVGPDGLPRPWAAEKADWVDSVTLDVTLRRGMKWHDGRPVTADDVIFSFTAPMGDEVPMYKPFVRNIERIEKRSDTVLRFVLREPYAPFLIASLAKLNIIPKHVWEPVLADLARKPENAESYQEQTPIGSGPFRFVQWKKPEEVILEAVPDHFAAPKMRRWILRIIPNVEAALGGLRQGQINFLSGYTGDPQLLDRLVKENRQLTLVSTMDVGMRFLAFNLRRPPFDDVAFRQALNMATNKRAIRSVVWKGFASIADSFVSPALEFWYNPEIPKWTYNIQAAREHLAKAGYSWDREGRLLYPAGKVETLK